MGASGGKLVAAGRPCIIPSPPMAAPRPPTRRPVSPLRVEYLVHEERTQTVYTRRPSGTHDIQVRLIAPFSSGIILSQEVQGDQRQPSGLVFPRIVSS
jgi:hypothetical protein